MEVILIVIILFLLLKTQNYLSLLSLYHPKANKNHQKFLGSIVNHQIFLKTYLKHKLMNIAQKSER